MAKRKAMTKSAILTTIGEETELTKKQVQGVFDSMFGIMKGEIDAKSRTAPGVFTIPGFCKVRTVKKPAKKARKGTNPFTGEPTTFKARPASIAVRLRPIKALKDAVN